MSWWSALKHVCVWSCVSMHMCHRILSKVDWKILWRLMWWIHGCDSSSHPAACSTVTPAGCVDKEGRGQITSTPGRKRQTLTSSHGRHKCLPFCFSPVLLNFYCFCLVASYQIKPFIPLLPPSQARVHGLVWSHHLSVWRVMEVPVSRGVLSQPDLHLNPTLKMRTPWFRWQNTAPLGLAHPCVPTATWSSGKRQILKQPW